MTASNTYEKQEFEHENDFLKCFILKTPHISIIFWQIKTLSILLLPIFTKNILELLISYLDPLKRLRKKKLLDFVISECVWRKYLLISERCHMM